MTRMISRRRTRDTRALTDERRRYLSLWSKLQEALTELEIEARRITLDYSEIGAPQTSAGMRLACKHIRQKLNMKDD
jgi:hypothetical protein